MRYRKLGRTGTRVSEICLGAMTFGEEADEATSRKILDAFLDAGGNFVDTADAYGLGTSEEILGRALGTRRERVVLATKFRLSMSSDPNDSGASRRHILRAIEGSLRRLATEWIDLYQIHLWDARTPLEETLSTLDDLVRDGKVRYLGASNYTGWQLAKALGVSARHDWEAFASLQAQYSLIARDAERELLPACQSEGIGMLAFSPLAGGALTGKYARGHAASAGTRGADGRVGQPGFAERLDDRSWNIVETVQTIATELGREPSQVALNWILEQGGVTATIVGARTADQLRANLGATEWTFGEEHRDALTNVSAFPLGYPYEMQRLMVRG
jgi:aryl-alcohol dehydrogenase-like predicted oxidoreductase